MGTVYPKKYAHGFCFAVLCCGYTLTDFPISIRLTSLALWQSNDCPSASKATLMNMDKYFMWIQYERLHNHNKAKHNKTVCIFLGIYCSLVTLNYQRYTLLAYLLSWRHDECDEVLTLSKRVSIWIKTYFCRLINGAPWEDIFTSNRKIIVGFIRTRREIVNYPPRPNRQEGKTTRFLQFPSAISSTDFMFY